MTARAARSITTRHAERGAVLLMVLVLIALMSLNAAMALGGIGRVSQRSSEEELLFVGEQYRKAIESYWLQAPGGMRQWPRKLEDLVEDNRFPKPMRHLRKLYRDPMDPNQSWGLIQVGAGIVGVYSQSAGEPFRVTGFPDSQRGFENARRYSDWAFKVEIKPSVTPGSPPGRPAQIGDSPSNPNASKPTAPPVFTPSPPRGGSSSTNFLK